MKRANESRTLNGYGFSVTSGNTYVEPVDLDQDGDIDIVSAVWGGISNGGLQWLENTGQNNLENPSFTRHTLEQNYNSERFVIADLDGDNDLDIAAITQRSTNGFISTRQDRTMWLENTASENDGTIGFTKHIIETGQGGTSIKTGDFDKDGKLDLLIGNRNKVAIYYQDKNADNQRIFTQRNQKLLDIAPSTYSDTKIHVESLDINKDGHLDVATVIGRKLHFWLNQNALDGDDLQQFEAHEIEASSYDMRISEGSALRSADFNGDGYPDLMASGSGGSDKLVVYLNQQDNSFRFENLVSGKSMSSAALRDVDDDGDMDILWAGRLQSPAQTAWIENRGTNAEGEMKWQTHVISSNVPNTLESADLNGDGINDWIYDHSWYNGAMQTQQADKFIRIGGSGMGYQLVVAHTDERRVMRVSLKVEKGTMTLANRDNLAFEKGDGRDDKEIIIRGFAEDINKALDGLVYAVDPEFSGTTGLNMTVFDGVQTRSRQMQFNVLAVDLAISSAADAFTVNQPFTIDFDFTSPVTGFNADDIRVSGSADAVVANSFVASGNGRHYQVQVLPRTEQDLIIQVEASAAINADQARSSGALALFCVAANCQFPSGDSDPDNEFPTAGEQPEEDDSGDTGTGGDTGSGGDTDSGGDTGGGSGGGGGSLPLWLMLMAAPLLLRRKLH